VDCDLTARDELGREGGHAARNEGHAGYGQLEHSSAGSPFGHIHRKRDVCHLRAPIASLEVVEQCAHAAEPATTDAAATKGGTAKSILDGGSSRKP
jgi:hypothetical protein